MEKSGIAIGRKKKLVGANSVGSSFRIYPMKIVGYREKWDREWGGCPGRSLRATSLRE